MSDKMVEIRMVDPVTGGEKGSKEARFDLIPGDTLEDIARHYGRGSLKYADWNWLKGYKWSLSFAAMMRHAWYRKKLMRDAIRLGSQA